ncbi:thiol-disulfide oxidoreductase DCC family protein [Zunongwangia sp. HGR-M22]|uniref:thiol-disulfide oxidoreductase DCC family protein n=1 Tax=Zunongwangia sp. HGR-M22 TaxID=3015168 RepID=UPI0022DD3F0E|nr:thiol-disulfide oxidoreductase DCC family protein [Zunongwangia sp. HGR-M22]WBL27335.1 thiol-disulfide oxidoreductase DCC family protein [Zunongwangia sp. HGR-M22]
MMNIPENKKIVLFDGVCNLCNDAVIFIIKHDKKDQFRFASLQGEIGKQLLEERGLDPNYLESIILIEPGIAWYQKSDAALEITKELSGIYQGLKIFKFLPTGLRDIVYKGIANNRYKWFGKKESCMIPTPELKGKFLD